MPMFCNLEPLPEAGVTVSVVVMAECASAALEQTLQAIARQTHQPVEVVILAPPGSARECTEVARCALPPELTWRVTTVESHANAQPALWKLTDDCVGTVIAVATDSEVWSPDFIAVAVARLAAPDGRAIAAVTTRDGGNCASYIDGECAFDHGDLTIEELLRQAAPRMASFVYRTEALQRSGGWSDLPPEAACWELHLRLLTDWRICLLPGGLVSRNVLGNKFNHMTETAFRSAQLRAALRRSPSQLGLLLMLARDHEIRDARENALNRTIDELSRKVNELKIVSAGLVAARADAGQPGAQDDDGLHLLHGRYDVGDFFAWEQMQTVQEVSRDDW